ncbi:transient receptor potential cation channel subfamily a member 1-like [Gigaspora margarita]|uniref:Transient receptor potential cation channel subfamily a member 1-like n=1 Tax=Gigaspora margarita TaxID=4874 RepID=A0A8H4EVF3_GIGMA|nr:transient receptor potential cation channel subfamily a member 1-like [Gigaspora margarita]
MSLNSDVHIIEDQDQTAILIDDAPHRGKRIDKYVFSPNMQYIATWSEDDKSIVGWTVSDELIVKSDSSVNSDHLKDIFNTDNLENVLRLSKLINRLIGVSNCKQIALLLDERDDPYNFEIIDIVTKSRQILNAQGLKGMIDRLTFLENGELVIIKGKPVYRAYIFSKSNNKRWKCKDSIELKKYYKAYIFKNGKLLLAFDIPFIIKQWNLITRKFEMIYILNWNISQELSMNFNSDCTLLAVYGDNIDTKKEQINFIVFIYSTKSGRLIANRMINDIPARNHWLGFISSGEDERLFVSGPQHDTKKFVSYLLNPHTHTFEKSPDRHALRDIYFPTFDEDNHLFWTFNIISDYIIKIDDNNLSIQKLSQNENWKNYLRVKEPYMGNTFFNVKEIKQFILSTLEKCKLNQVLIQNHYDEPKEYPCTSCTWVIETIILNNPFNIKYKYKLFLKAKIESDKETSRNKLFTFDSNYGYILENKVLENGDILLVFYVNHFSSIQIWALDSKKKTISLTYIWFDKFTPEIIEIASIIKLLTSFHDKLNDSEILTPPILERRFIRFADPMTCLDTDDYKLLNTMLNNSQIMILYGKDIINQIIREKDKDETMLKVLDNCFIHSLSMLKDGDIYNFVTLVDQITFTLVELEKYNKNLRVTERFLSKFNLLVPDKYDKIIDSTYLLFHLQHCATILLGFFHLSFEVRQLFHRPIHYISSPWNWFDLAAILVPTITSIVWLYDETPSIWIISIATFLLEIKFLLFFRVLEYFGAYFAIIIGVAQKIFSYLIILGIIILAFAHSLHLLLRPTTEYSYNQPSYTDDPNNPWNLVPTNEFISSNSTTKGSSLVETPDDKYQFVFSDTSAVSSCGLTTNWTLSILLILFSFFTTIYLLNLFIGLLSMAIEETNNEESFLQLKGEILSEIELFWMLPYQRRKKNWFPEILYYEASVNELTKYVKKIKATENEEEYPPHLSSAILEIAQFKDSNETLKTEIVGTLKNQIEEMLKNHIDEALKNQNEVLKDSIDKINKLFESIEKKE